jgi:hypothetical protein
LILPFRHSVSCSFTAHQELPAEEPPNLLIYADIETRLSFEIGSPARVAIQHACSDAQGDMVVAATVVWVLGLAAVFGWRDVNVSASKQVRGHVVWGIEQSLVWESSFCSERSDLVDDKIYGVLTV